MQVILDERSLPAVNTLYINNRIGGHVRKESDRLIGGGSRQLVLFRIFVQLAPDRQRQTTWATFLKAHWEVLAAIDFTTIEVWTQKGLVTYYLLFVMEFKTRRVHFAGCTPNPNEAWMKQVARNLTDTFDGFLQGKRYLLIDRDGKFCDAFREMLKNEGVKPLRLPLRSPNLNANLEWYFRSLKQECLSRMIFFGEKSLHHAIHSFIRHYHEERNHRGLANKIIEPNNEVGLSDRDISCRERLGGILRYYFRRVAWMDCLTVPQL